MLKFLISLFAPQDVDAALGAVKATVDNLNRLYDRLGEDKDRIEGDIVVAQTRLAAIKNERARAMRVASNLDLLLQ